MAEISPAGVDLIKRGQIDYTFLTTTHVGNDNMTVVSGRSGYRILVLAMFVSVVNDTTNIQVLTNDTAILKSHTANVPFFWQSQVGVMLCEAGEDLRVRRSSAGNIDTTVVTMYVPA